MVLDGMVFRNNGKVSAMMMMMIVEMYAWILVTDIMQRESAIADDFWRSIFQHSKENHLDRILENLERK